MLQALKTIDLRTILRQDHMLFLVQQAEYYLGKLKSGKKKSTSI